MLITAQYILALILFLFLVLHFCILFRLIPYDFVWGARLQSVKEMYRFETVSIIVNAILIIIVLSSLSLFPWQGSDTFYKITFGLFAILFIFNCFANALSKNKFEKMLFTPVTIVMALLSIYIALNI